jgi:ABC exporter DevB family membrane fusion protein
MNGRRLALTALVLAGLASVMVLRGAAGAAPKPDASEMSGAPAAAVVAGPGRVEAASEEIEVGPELSGKLAAVLVEEGDVVQAGQVLARLEQDDHRARVAAAEARLRVAEAERLRLQNGARPEERREALAVADQAEASLEHARLEVERSRRLFADGVIARDVLDRAERDWRVASARQTETAERLATVDADARADDLARADANVALARATLAEARAVLGKTVVRAPTAGVVLRRHKQAGESVSVDSPDAAIVTLADTRTLRVRVDVDERDVAAVRVGQPAWVTADAYGETRFEGRVIRVGSMLGRKNVRTDEPAEKVDTKVLETLVELAPGTRLPIGLRVDAFLVR